MSDKKDGLEKMVDAKGLAKAFDVARQTIHVWLKTTDFPKPFKIGHKNFWNISEIEAYKESKRKSVQ